MIICSVDLALSTTGVCIFDISLNKVLKYDKISTKYGIIKKEDEVHKIFFIVSSIMNLAIEYGAKMIIVEDQFVGGFTSKKTSMLLSRLRGALDYCATSNDMPIASIPCATIKKEICQLANIPSGQDSKESVAQAVRYIFKDDEYVLSIGPYCDKQTKLKTSDIYDAIAISVVYAKR